MPADHDDTYYPDGDEPLSYQPRNQWKPEPRHAKSGRRHIDNIRAQLAATSA